MKKLLILAAAAMIAVTGCKTVPDQATVSMISKTTGMAAAYACQIADVDPEVKDAIVSVMEMLKNISPDEQTSCYDCWMPVIKAELDKLEQQGKINSIQKSVATTVLTLAAEGIDYMLDKNPKWKQYANIVTVAIGSFCDGFTQVMNPLKKSVLAKSPSIDVETFTYLKMRYEILKQSKK